MMQGSDWIGGFQRPKSACPERGGPGRLSDSPLHHSARHTGLLRLKVQNPYINNLVHQSQDHRHDSGGMQVRTFIPLVTRSRLSMIDPSLLIPPSARSGGLAVLGALSLGWVTGGRALPARIALPLLQVGDRWGLAVLGTLALIGSGGLINHLESSTVWRRNHSAAVA
jgi:hypothetical protein